MNLPPRVKTQYPTARNIIETEIIPVPIETVFFLEDGKQDPYQPNRYYFDYPGNWATSNNGENIIGLRSIKLHRSPIKIYFRIRIAKYEDEVYKENYENSYENTIIKLDQKNLAKVSFLEVSYLIKPDDFNYDNFFDVVNNTVIEFINKGLMDGLTQSILIPSDRDIAIEGYYDKNGYHIKIFSERNENGIDDTKLSFEILDANDNFKELFNVPNINRSWKKELIFDNVWDLKPCNVYSSIAEQSAHHYIGTTDTVYPEIKYFKLNSSDQRF